ncbi:MAG: pyruvate dehydrogenase complex dihydrolipoamide acetyltransferase [Alphaproteobacteria bacterium 64-11]|nr:pyruvate dehydrogenase complex dihydrolipoamide acetyltransferase [Alphaproteobacteria bacterium]OJU11745.1 MAG: pyruvate dehydrogenase complex dihydrolipoamide acetyltransferase [Alphaproteobacteria bacterium 64-11]
MATNILMPALSPTMEEGKLAKWLVKEGDTVRSGDILAEIETDKATMEFEAVDEGRIGRILVPDGTEGVKVNAPIAVLLDEGESADAVPAPINQDIPAAMKDIGEAVKKEAGVQKADTARTVEAKAEPQKAGVPAPATGERIFASPLARRIAADKGIDLAALAGTGPRGRIVKADVEGARPGIKATPAAIAAPSAGAGIPGIAPLPDARLLYPAGSYQEIPHDSMRKAIAKRLTSAKTLIPHYYLTIDCNLDALMVVREKMNAAASKGKDKVPAYKLSVNDFIVKASAMALMKHPAVNASWTDTAILRHKDADVGVAVALDFGLITPIVFKAQTKGLVQISNEIKELAARAREKKLKPAEYEGGGFSVSNLGMYGIKNFTSIINPPQSCIIAVGAGEERPVVKNGKIEISTVMTVTMSADHRVVDGGTGARFLATLKQFIEEPASMLL